MHRYTGIAAALFLIFCCFFPWAYYPDLQQNFTGFYSDKINMANQEKLLFFFLLFPLFFS